MSTLTYTILTTCYPYFMAGIEFRPVIAHQDGRFVCRDCTPHGAPRRARLQAHLPNPLEADTEDALN